MALTDEQLSRAYAAEASQLRMLRLQQLSYRELQEILSGDPAQAAVWIRSAADCGLAAAQLRLGRMLLDGTGVVTDARAALAWFTRAAAQGDAEAMNMVGRCLENGWGTPADASRAAAQYRLAAQRGHDWGEYNFGNMLFDGRGVACDRRLAVYWYRRAARQGHSRAMNLLGRCLEEGWGCGRNPAHAVLWYERAAKAGYFRGQFNYAAVLAQHGQCAAAASWYLQAAAGGDHAIRCSIVTALINATDPALVAVRARIARQVTAARQRRE
ncbi:MAG TPA: tetratricopeptide repeat protein [Steroidobacteraceae bacterium]